MPQKRQMNIGQPILFFTLIPLQQKKALQMKITVFSPKIKKIMMIQTRFSLTDFCYEKNNL